MSIFKEESQFVLANWDRVQELIAAVDVCRSEMGLYLGSLETLLRNKPWWEEGLRFVKKAPAQVYITRADWADNEDVIWIGVESFTIESVFGGTLPPRCYLWLAKRAGELAGSLLALVKNDPDLSAFVSAGSGQNERYILSKRLSRSYPEQFINSSMDAPLDEIADFFGKTYAAVRGYTLPERQPSPAT